MESVYKTLRECKKFVAKSLEGKNFNSVLEVGTQWGESLEAIKELYPDKQYVGVDIDRLENPYRLDIIYGNVLEIPFADKSFDVVFTNALFCNLSPDLINKGLSEIIRVASKYIYLVELELPSRGFCKGGRTGANWVELFKEKGLIATKRKTTEKEWGVEPWLEYGHIYEIIL
jgi:ubiquinone/menaquinone biosynthesis C-methylase UbiE